MAMPRNAPRSAQRQPNRSDLISTHRQWLLCLGKSTDKRLNKEWRNRRSQWGRNLSPLVVLPLPPAAPGATPPDLATALAAHAAAGGGPHPQGFMRPTERPKRSLLPTVFPVALALVPRFCQVLVVPLVTEQSNRGRFRTCSAAWPPHPEPPPLSVTLLPVLRAVSFE